MKNSGFIFSNQSLKKTRITQAFHFGEEFLDDETRTNNNKKNYIISPRKNTRSGLKKITDNEKIGSSTQVKLNFQQGNNFSTPELKEKSQLKKSTFSKNAKSANLHKYAKSVDGLELI
jgi:ribosomal protein S8E